MANRNLDLLERQTTGAILDAFRTVHRTVGFGFRELIYSLAMERELVARGQRVVREVAVMVYYRGEPLARQTIDMIVNDRVIIENKTGERLHPEAEEQLSSYLSSTDLEVGLVLHFGRKAEFRRTVCENRFKNRRA